MGGLPDRVTATGSSAAPASAEPAPPITANEFVPERRDLGECITAVPRPDCGSEGRADWHQGLVLALMVAGLVFIGWRIARAVRHRNAALSVPVRDEDHRG